MRIPDAGCEESKQREQTNKVARTVTTNRGRENCSVSFSSVSGASSGGVGLVFNQVQDRRIVRRYIMSSEAGAGLLPRFSSGYCAIMHSVVSASPAMEAAFCSAMRVTLQGSSTPICTMSPY